MIKKLIEDDEEAKRIADVYGVSESMMAEMERRLPDSIAAGTGLVVAAKRAKDIENLGAMTGPFEFVFITYMAGFIEGGNGWSVMRWSDVSWDELPTVVLELEWVEKQALPHAVNADTATVKFEAYKKEQQHEKQNIPDAGTGAET